MTRAFPSARPNKVCNKIAAESETIATAPAKSARPAPLRSARSSAGSRAGTSCHCGSGDEAGRCRNGCADIKAGRGAVRCTQTTHAPECLAKRGLRTCIKKRIKSPDLPIGSVVMSSPFKWRLTVAGVPVPKGRPRHTKKGHTYTPEKTRRAERDMRNLALLSGVRSSYGGEVSVRLMFFMPDHRRVDIDNLCKLAFDALFCGCVVTDDAQIVHLECWKFIDATNPCTRIEVEST